VEIVEGLNKEDTVVTAGQMKLRNEAPVMPINQSAPTDTDSATGTAQ
jgi:hypothetical protein